VRNALHVESATGERWDLALELLREGGINVHIGGTMLRYQEPLGGVLLRRDAASPLDDGRVHVVVLATRDRPTRRSASDDVSAGRQLIDAICLSDRRLAGLFRDFGSTWTFGQPYDGGSMSFGDISDDGSIRWSRGFEPES